MHNKHLFVSVLDVEELLPFVVRKERTLQESFDEQDRAKTELSKFIDLLEKNFKEQIFYIGIDVIGEKSYERFMFKESGFLEIMTEAPIALTAHFPQRARSEQFAKALRKTFQQILPKGPQTSLFVDSIEVENEQDTSLRVEEWHKIKNVREKQK